MRSLLMVVAFLLILPASFATLLDRNTLTAGVGVTALAMAGLLAITYMMSRSMNLPQLEAWTKSEVRELLVAAILFVVVNAIFFGTTPLVQTLTGRSSPEDAAGDFLAQMRDDTQTAYLDMIRLFHALTLRSGFSVLAATPPPYTYLTITSAPYSGAGIFFGPLSNGAQGLANTWFVYSGVFILYEFIIRAAGILLPLAFIVRFIPFTRQLGNTLLALAIGSKVLLPFAIIIVAQMHQIVTVDVPRVPESTFNKLDISDLLLPFEVICSNIFLSTLLNLNETGFALLGCLPVVWIPGAYPACVTALIEIYPIIEMVFRIGYAIVFATMGLLSVPSSQSLGSAPIVGGLFLSGTELTDLMYDFLLPVNNFVLFSYLDILVISLIAYGGTKSISTALGGDYMMPVVSRLVR